VESTAAISVLDFAFVWGFAYLEPGRAEAWFDAPVMLPPLAGIGLEDSVSCRAVRISSFAGTSWSFLFGLEDGRLHGIQELGAEPARWARFGDWKRWGELTLPSVRLDGKVGLPFAQRILVERVTSGVAHEEALFRGSPAERVPAWEDGGPLDVVLGAVPSSALFVVPEVRLRGSAPVPALLDTGSAELAVD